MEKAAGVSAPLTPTDIQKIVSDDQSGRDLSNYFTSFGGRHFDALDGGGARAAVAARITAADLIAVQTLSVQVPSPVCVDLLEGDLGDRVSHELMRIPTDVAIGSPQAHALLQRDEGAWNAWNLLRTQHKVGDTITSKLLARKRPRLIPICDDVVACAIGRPANPWEWFQQVLCDKAVRAELDRRAVELRLEAVTPARLLDVIIWMRHQNDHRKPSRRGNGPEPLA